MTKEKGVSILFLTKYSREGASSRYRFLQYFPYLESRGIACAFSPLTDSRYLKHMYASGKGTVGDIASALFRRLCAMLTACRYDVLMIEYEILPYFPPVLEKMLKAFGIPYIVNYDDAIFYRYSQHPNTWVRRLLGKKIDTVMQNAAFVIAGNDHLADYARRAGASRVELLPTVIDLDRYPDTPRPASDVFTIGWIGSPSTAKYLKDIAPALAKVCEGGRGKVVLIGSGEIRLPGVPVEVRPWSEATEVGDLRLCDIGIMPLYDGLWERGKCALKLIQYMACGLPVVVSPVGVNKEIVKNGVNGYLAGDNAEWRRALTTLRDDASLREAMGKAGRIKVESAYSLQVTAPRLERLLEEAAKS